MKLLERFATYLEKPDGFSLRIELLNGNKMNVAVYEVFEDGLLTEAKKINLMGSDITDVRERRFIPLTSVAFFDIEW